MSRFELDCKTSYPPILIDKKTGQQCIIVSQTEVFLATLLVELDEKINSLQERIDCIGKRVFRESSQPPKTCYNEKV